MPCLTRLWGCIWPDVRYPNVPNNTHVIANPAAHAAEIRTVSGDIRVPSPKKRQVQLYAALFDFEARSDDELTVKEGDKLSVIEKRGEYVLAKKLTGSLESGLIPANYVALLQDEFAKHKSVLKMQPLLFLFCLHSSSLILHSPNDYRLYGVQSVVSHAVRMCQNIP